MKFAILIIGAVISASAEVFDETPTLQQINYLKKYEYLDIQASDKNGAAISDIKQVYKAICKFQEFFNLEVTCRMNQETRDLMKKPRCGFPDLYIKNNEMSNYNLQGSRWSRKLLSWRVVQHTDQVTKDELHEAIVYSFNVWAEVSGLSFEHKESGDVDMEIGFYTGVHLGESSGSAFDGPGGTLAHAYFPISGGDTHMDNDETWGVDRPDGDFLTKSLVVVLVHEFGHALGLRHEPDVSDSIMRPIYSGWSKTVTLSQDDINGITALYGENTDTTTPTTTTASTTSTTSTSTTPATTTSTAPPSTTTQTSTTTATPTPTNGGPSSTTASTKPSTSTTTTPRPTSTTEPMSTSSKNPEEKEDFCRNPRIDAIFEFRRNSYFAFKGNSVMVISMRYSPRVFLISQVFKGTLNQDKKIDAAFSQPSRYAWLYRNGRMRYTLKSAERIFLFQGDKVHAFGIVNRRLVEKFAKKISEVFIGIPSDIDAAFVWSGNRQVYLTKGKVFYGLKRRGNRFVKRKNFPRGLQSWKGLPEEIDSAVYLRTYGTTMFFKGDKYYMYEDGHCRVPDVYPLPINSDWFGCSSFENLVSDSTEVVEEGLSRTIYKITNGISEMADMELTPPPPPSPADGSNSESFQVSQSSEQEDEEASSGQESTFEEVLEPWERNKGESVNEVLENNRMISSSACKFTIVFINGIFLYLAAATVSFLIHC